MVRLDPTVGDEMRKTRPAVVVSRDALGILALRVVVPLTAWQPTFASWDWQVRLDPTPGNGLQKPSAADTFQVRSISARRFAQRLGRLDDADVERVAEAMRVVLEL